jgi:predicted nucleic acid-binding protein
VAPRDIVIRPPAGATCVLIDGRGRSASISSILLDRPHIRAPGEADGFWSLYRVAAGDRARGSEVPDGHLAALMRQHGVRLIYTRDRDFRRFDGIDAQDPFA